MISLVAITATTTAAVVAPKELPAQSEKMPVTGILSASNSEGIIKYCAEKGFISSEEAETADADKWLEPDIDPKVRTLSQQAEAVGKRGVMFTFGEGESSIPAATLEDIAALDDTTPQSICQNLAHAGDETTGPADEDKQHD
ncbi:hypothetical protein DUT91_23860 [Phyllobacterium salinisoli]|uniref:Uncharacterized protein n=1 Tax=Phyllobacterium salinisoli TaxID=1899321 RepID=A0A368JWD1_9HYPH|nr:hypothetical protein DUT91_23860 [Phyllobacterium salinisoli]